jgi:hypothetical protein
MLTKWTLVVKDTLIVPKYTVLLTIFTLIEVLWLVIILMLKASELDTMSRELFEQDANALKFYEQVQASNRLLCILLD